MRNLTDCAPVLAFGISSKQTMLLKLFLESWPDQTMRWHTTNILHSTHPAAWTGLHASSTKHHDRGVCTRMQTHWVLLAFSKVLY